MKILQKVINSIGQNESNNPAPGADVGAPYNGFGYSNNGGVGSGAKWYGGLSRSGQSLNINHHAMRINSRMAYHDSPQARSIVDRYADVVVDTGLKLLPTPDADLLGISGEEAEKWADRVGRKFDLWMRSKDCMASGKMTGYQAQRLYEIFQQRDGEIFTRFYYGLDDKTASPLQFDFVDPSQLKGCAFTNTIGIDNGFDDGIKRDAYGKEISYSVWVKRQNGEYETQEIPARGESGRIHMIHGFAPEYASQGRGYSRIGHALQEFQNITDFSLSTIKKAISQSQITMFVEPSDDEDAINPLAGISQFGAAADQFGSNPKPSADAQNVEINNGPSVEYCPIPGANFNEPGSTGVYNLTKGSKLVPFQNSTPGESFDSFVNGFTSYITASTSMPLEVQLMKFNSNYSASRGALILFWRVAQIWRNEMDSDFITPLYEMYLSEEIAAGRESAFGWSDPALKAAWLSHDLQGSSIPNIDDKKAAQANEINLKLNATDLDRVAADTNGSNGKANRSKLTRQIKNVALMPWSKKNAK